MNAVYMRNMLHLTIRTAREEQDDESEEFVQVFGGEIQYRVVLRKCREKGRKLSETAEKDQNLPLVTSHIFVRLARMADFKTERPETQLKIHEIEKPLKPCGRAKSELFKALMKGSSLVLSRDMTTLV